MKLNTLYKVTMVAMMAMVSMNSFAQHRGGGREMHFGHNGVRMENRNGNYNSNVNVNNNVNVNSNYNGNHNDNYRMEGGRHDDRRYDDRHMDRRYDDRHMDRRYDDRHMDRRYDDRHMDRHHAYAGPRPQWDRHGYLPGWEGRVRYVDGRYGYLRGNDWYWYDTYYEPDYYYAHPVAHFHAHRLSPAGRAVVGAVAGTIALASIISALAH